jgi:hypothetical protein
MKTLFVFFMALFFVLPVVAQENSNITLHRIQAAERDASGWYPAISTYGTFRISLPLPFNDFTVHAKDTNNGQIDMQIVGCKSSDGYTFTVIEMPIFQKTKISDLETIVEKFKGDRKNTVAGVDNSSYAGFSTISFEVAGPNSGAFMRYINANNSLMMVTLEYPKGGRDSAIKMKARFFDSVQWKSSITNKK